MALTVEQKNYRLVRLLLIVVIGMFGFGYALVPLYNVLCEITGLNGKQNVIPADKVTYKVDSSRQINVEFLTSINQQVPLDFKAQTSQLTINPGRYYTVNFTATNKSERPMLAQAIPSFSPGLVAKYFEKVECFCFNQQSFQAGETKVMPMRFVVKPELPEQYKTITLSYTFFDNTDTTKKN
jgi:cytochrome c oxidase assembly protein subunit 11